MFKSLYLFLSMLIIATSSTHAQVDFTTGRALANFPLFNYDDGKLSTSINLAYTGGNGIKVNELASNVGLGWTMMTGGVISRSTRGEPDDQVGGTLDGNVYATGRAFSSYAYTDMPAKAAWIPLMQYKIPFYRHDASVIDDREADVFQFSFNGRGGSFVISTNGTVRVLDNSNLKIEKVTENLSASGILTRWSKFIITDEGGIKYTFSEKGLDRIIFYESTSPKRFFLNPAPANMETYVCGQNYKITNYSIINNWYLSEIYDPLSQKRITFSYEDYNLEYLGDIQAIFSQSPTSDGLTKSVAQKIQPRYKGIMKRLVGINIPGSTQVQFSYYNTERVDLPGDKALQRITVKKNGIDVSGYLFDYQYFSLTNVRDFNYGFTAAEAPNARLCLKSFRRYGQKTVQVIDAPYTFSYNLGGSLGVPARNTASMDHYGYFNSATYYPYDTDENTYKNLQNLCFPNRRPVIGTVSIMGAGVLTGITYPTGGSLTYDYEANTALNGTSSVRTAGIRVKKTIESDGLGVNSDVVKEYRYVLEDGAASSGWGYEEPQYSEVSQSRLIITTAGTFNALNMAYSVATPALKSLVPDNIKTLGIPDFSDPDGNPSAVPKEVDRTRLFFNALLTGLVSKALFYIIDQFSNHIVTEDETTTLYYSDYSQKLNALPTQYSRVEIYDGTVTNNIGKTVNEYTTDKDFSISFPSLSLTGAANQRYFYGIYGLLKNQQVFNKRGELVTSTYNRYSPYLETLNDAGFESRSYKPNMSIVAPEPLFNANSSIVRFVVDKYYPLIARPLLMYTVNKRFTGTDPEITKVEYEYDPLYYGLKKSIEWNSLNEKKEERFYYPYNYTGLPIAQQMMNNHIYNIPISTETWIFKDGENERMVNAVATEYQVIGNGEIRASKRYMLTTNSSLTASTIGTFNPSVLVRDNKYYVEAESYLYNSTGRIQTTSAFNRVSTYVYDDNGDQVVAKVANASISDIGYSSFEPGAKGTWTVTLNGSATASVLCAAAPTGEYCLDMSKIQSISKNGLSAGKKYILSYWSKGGSINISGGTKTNETISLVKNGWTLVTMYINSTTTLVINGTGLIDELRLYPSDGVLSSIALDAQSNIISSMGADNVATYYAYDELGRLIATYDADRNLVSAAQYKYRQ